jgi:hypothetical protein
MFLGIQTNICSIYVLALSRGKLHENIRAKLIKTVKFKLKCLMHHERIEICVHSYIKCLVRT